MPKIHQHITQLKEILQQLEEHLDKYTNEDLLAEKVTQLNGIEKTIRNLQKSNTAIPSELRELKLSLVTETDNWQEAKAMQPEIIDLLESFVTKYGNKPKAKNTPVQHKRIVKKQRKKEGNEQVTVSDVLEAELIKPGIELFRTYKGTEYFASIQPDGSIETSINGTVEQFNTPSAAAVAVSNKSQNGWIWWFTSFEGTKRELNYYRKKYIDSINS